MPDTTIDADAGVTTLINHFTVAPERQRELVELLAAAEPVLYTVESVHHR